MDGENTCGILAMMEGTGSVLERNVPSMRLRSERPARKYKGRSRDKQRHEVDDGSTNTRDAFVDAPTGSVHVITYTTALSPRRSGLTASPSAAPRYPRGSYRIESRAERG